MFTAIIRYRGCELDNEFSEAESIPEVKEAALSNSASNCTREMEIQDHDFRTIERWFVKAGGRSMVKMDLDLRRKR